MTRFSFRMLATCIALFATASSSQACWFTSCFHGSSTAYYAPAPVAAYYAPPVATYYAPQPVCASYAPACSPCNTCNTCNSCPTQSCGYAPVTSYYQPITTMRPVSYYYPQTSYYSAPACNSCGSACSTSACSNCSNSSCDGCSGGGGGSAYYTSGGGNSGCSTCAGSSSGTVISNPTYSSPSPTYSSPSPTPATVNPGPANSTFETRRPVIEERKPDASKAGPMMTVPMGNPADNSPAPSKTSTSPGLFQVQPQDKTASLPVVRGWTAASPNRTVTDLVPASDRKYVEVINLND